MVAEQRKSVAEQVRGLRDRVSHASLDKRRKLMDAIDLRIDLIGFEGDSRRFRVTSLIGAPREFVLMRHRR